MNKLIFCFTLLFLTTSITSAAEIDVALLQEKPESYEALQRLKVDSRDSRARNKKARREYVREELQRQAAELGADAVLVTDIKEGKQKVATTGGSGRFASVKYRTVSYFVGTGVAIKTHQTGIATIVEDR